MVIPGIKWVNFVSIVDIEIRKKILVIFSKKRFFVAYLVGELVFQRVFAEKLVKLYRLQILHYVIVF